MKSRAPMALAALALLAGGGWWWLTLDSGPSCGSCPVGVPEDPPGPEAVLAIDAGRDGTEAAVLRGGGRVDFVALADGSVRASIETGARAWAIRYAHPHDGPEPPGSGFKHDPTTLLAGLPASSVGGRTAAIAGEELLEWTGVNAPRRLLRDPRIAGARLVSQSGPGTPVWIALADHRIARLQDAGPLAISGPLPWRITAMAAAEGAVLVGGEGDGWILLRGGNLDESFGSPIHGFTPPITAITVTRGSRHAVVAHGLCYPVMDSFELRGQGRPTRGREYFGKPPGAVSMAFAGGEGWLYFGKSCGGSGYCPPEGGYFGAPLGGNPQRGLHLFENDHLLLHGWDDGTLFAEGVPGEQKVWGKRADGIR